MNAVSGMVADSLDQHDVNTTFRTVMQKLVSVMEGISKIEEYATG
jgi:hypothetical protein